MNIVETERLVLRTWQLNDTEALFEIYSDPEVYRFTSAEPFPDLETARRYVEFFMNHQKEYGFCLWAVVEKASGKIIGACGLGYFDGRPELGLGYHFIPAYWGRGYATEATRACIEYAFDKINALELAAMTDPHNLASQRVLERAGLMYVGIAPADDGTDGMLYVARKPG